MRRNILLVFNFFCLLAVYAQPFNRAITLNGVNDYIVVPNNSAFYQSSNMTIEAWIKPCEINGYRAIVNRQWCAASRPSYHFSIRNGHIEFVWSNNGNCNYYNSYRSDLPLAQVNVWQHVAVVHTSTGIDLYYNGALVVGNLINGSYGNIRNTSEPLRIGVYKNISGNYGGFFHGGIDEVRIWNTNLNSTQIMNRYNTPLNGNENNLVAYYAMDGTQNGSPTTALNSGQVHGAVLNGTTVGTVATPIYGNSTPVVDLGNDTIICQGTNIELNSGVTGATYAWNNGSLGSSISVVDSGTYWVEVTKGCDIVRDSIKVDFPESIAVSAGPDTIICKGDSVQLNGSTTSLLYSWGANVNAGNSLTPWVMPEANTIFTLQADDSLGCPNTSSVLITVRDLPGISVGEDTTLCVGESIELQALGGTAYAWSANPTLSDPSISNPVATPIVNETYIVEGSDAYGCVNFDTVVINTQALPLVEASLDTTICYGDSIQISATGGEQYSWGVIGGTLALSGSNIWVTPSESSVYTVVGEDLIGCQGIDSVIVDVIPLPNVVANPSSIVNICLGDSVQLNAMGAIDYIWDASPFMDVTTTHSPWVFPDTSVYFTVSGTSVEGCVGRDSVLVNVYNYIFQIPEDTVMCKGDVLSLTITGGDSSAIYSWSPTSSITGDYGSMIQVSPDSSTQFTVSIQGNNGCEIEENIFVTVNEIPEPYFVYELAYSCNGVRVDFTQYTSDDYQYKWTFSDGKESFEPHPFNVFNYDRAFNATITIWDSIGCSSSYTSSQEIVLFDELLYNVPNVFTPNNDGINDVFYIELNEGIVECVSFNIYNRWGQLLYEAYGSDVVWDGKVLNGAPASEGTYYYSLSIQDKLYKGTINLMR
ncbi:MAG: gliding motility-associated C-terminal domain-containing protein [Flavobacteriales bacterium]|nr:gliding motility-associated C-terminal domain-containing protein [Flavobacteriales bacterium]